MIGLTEAIKTRFESDLTLLASIPTLYYGWPADRTAFPYATLEELVSSKPQFSLNLGSRIIRPIYQIVIYHYDNNTIKSLHNACFARFKDWVGGAITGGTHLATQEVQESYLKDSAMVDQNGQLIYRSVHTFQFYADRA